MHFLYFLLTIRRVSRNTVKIFVGTLRFLVGSAARFLLRDDLMTGMMV